MIFKKRKLNRRLSFILTLAMIIGMMPGVTAKALPSTELLIAMHGTEFDGYWGSDASKAIVLRGAAEYVENQYDEHVSGIRIVPAHNNRLGSASFVQPLRIDRDFSVAFRVFLGAHGGSNDLEGAFGEGFSFIFSKGLSQNESGLGYAGSSNSIAVEYDTLYNSTLNDPSGFGGDNAKPHIAIDTNSSTQHTYASGDYSVATWNNGENYYVYFWVDYDESAQNLVVRANNENDKNGSGAVFVSKTYINLANELNSDTCHFIIAADNYECYQDTILTDIYAVENDSYFNSGIDFSATYTGIAQNPYYVQYDLNCADATSAAPASGYYPYRADFTVASAPVRPGYDFDGWTYTYDGHTFTIAAGDTFYSLPGNITFTAKWTARYNISYDANGGTGTTPTPTTLRADATYTAASGTGLSKTDYYFDGWYYTQGSNTYNVAAGGSVSGSALTGDITLKAKWVAKTNPIITTTPGALGGIAYSGTNENLISSGATADGTFMYAIGTSSTTPPADGWNTSIPQAVSADEYNVWYKVVGDGTHLDTTPALVNPEPWIGYSLYFTEGNETATATTPTPALTVFPAGTTLNFLQNDPSLGLVKEGYYVRYWIDQDQNVYQNWTGWWGETGTAPSYTVTMNKDLELRPYLVVKPAANVTAPTANNRTYNGEYAPLASNWGGSTDTGIVYQVTEAKATITPLPSAWAAATPLPQKDAATYRLWYKSTGNYKFAESGNNYIDVTISPLSVSIVTPAVRSNLVYNGSSQTLVYAGSLSSNNETLAAADVELQYRLNNNGTWSTALPSAIYTGDYAVWFKLAVKEGKTASNYSLPAEAYVVPSIDFATILVTPPVGKTGLIFNNNDQALITTGSPSVGTMKYLVTAQTVDTVTGSEAGWSTTNYYKTDSGYYRVWYKVDLPDNIRDEYYPVPIGHVDVSIAKKPVVVTTPEIVNRTYTGSDQELAIAGSVDGGTMKYFAATTQTPSSVAFTTGLPKGQEVGDYYIWISVVPDSNHTLDGSGYADPGYYEAHIYAADINTTDTEHFTAPVGKTDLVYNGTTQTNGTAQTLITEGSCSYGTMKYAVTTTTATPTPLAYTTSVPAAANAGTYYVWYMVEADDNYNDYVATTPITVTIAKKQSAYTTLPSALTGLAYTGSAQVVLDYGAYTGGMLQFCYSYPGNGCTAWFDYTSDYLKVTAAGTYNFYYKIDGGDNFTGISANIEPIQVTISTISLPGFTAPAEPTGAARTYTGSPLNLCTYTHNVQAPYNVFFATSVTSTTQPSDDEGNWSLSIPQATNVRNVETEGYYHIWYKIVSDSLNPGNYSTSFVGHFTTNILKAAPTYTLAPATPSPSLVYNTSSQALLTAGTTSDGTIKYKVRYKDNGTNSEFGTYSDYSTAVPTGTAAGTYEITYKIFGDGNHNDSTETTVTVTIAKANATFTAPTALGGDYEGIDIELVNAGQSSQGTTIKYAVTETTVTQAPAEGWATGVPSRTNYQEGGYRVWYKLEGGNNYNNIAAAYVDAAINKVEAEFDDEPDDAHFTYTGNAITLLTTPATSTEGEVRYAVTTTDTAPASTAYATGVPTRTDVGTYYVWYMIAGDGNHTDNTGNYVTIVIDPMAPSIGTGSGDTPTLHADSIYDGDPINLVTNLGQAAEEGAVIWFAADDATATAAPAAETAWTTSSPQRTAVGEYKVWYKIVGTGNYGTVTGPELLGTVEITKAAPEITPPVGLTNLEYTGELQTLITAGSVGQGQGTMKYAVGDTKPADSAFSEELPKGSSAGTYTVWYMVQGNDNYATVTPGASRTVTARINGIDPTYTSPVANILTYNTEEQALTTAGYTEHGTIKFTTTETAAAPTPGASWSTTVPKGTDAGTYYVWFYVDGDSNHNDTDPELVEVEIAKATPNVTPPANIALQTYQGTPLEILTEGHTGSGTMYYAVGNNEPAWGTSAWSTSIPKETEVGNYYTWYYVTESDNYRSAGPTAVSGYARIDEAPAGITVPHGKNLTFNNEDQELVTAGSATGGTMLYAVSESNQAAPESGWDDDVPEAKIAGTYYIWYYVDGDDNHDDTEKSFVTTTIARHAAVYTAPEGRRLIFNNTPYDLVIAGSVNGADAANMLYSIGTETEAGASWSATVPQATGVDGYWIWYKSPETTNYLEAVGKVYTTINSGAEITYHANGASGTAPAMDTVPAGYDYTISGNTGNLSMSGKVFAGWNTEPDASGTVYLAGDVIVPTADLNLYAVWVDSLKAQALADPYGLNLNYKGEYQNLVVAGITSGGQLIYALGDSYETMPSTGWSPSIPRGIAEGTYWIWYYVKGDAYHEDSVPSRLRSTIGSGSTVISGGGSQGGGSQGGGSYNPPESTATPTPQATPTPYGFGNSTYTPAPVYTATPTPRPVASVVTAPSGKDLIYNGSLQVLATAGSAFNGSMWYALGDSSSAPVLGWNSSIPSASEIGTYYIWYWVVGDDGYDNTAKSYVVSNITGLRPTATPTNTATPTPAVTATPTPIVKIPSFVVKAPNGKTLPYTGAAQTLAGSGSAGGGVMVYALGNDGSTAPASGWSESVPSGTDAGTYYIWYKVVADDKHIDNTPDYVISTISRTTQEAPVEYYEEVQVTDGVVKDITGTEEAPAETNPLSATIDNNDELETLLSVQADEKSIGVNVWLEVTDVTDIIPEEEKQAIEEGASDDYTVAVYVDVSLFKKIGTEDEKKIHETDGKVKISILIPEELREEGREYQMIRYHDGETTVLEGIYDPETFMFTFETDQFSSYAIAYKEDNGISVKPSKTSESRALDLWLSFMMAAMGGLTILGYFYKKREEER